ncbi:MAG: NusA-like transcription termination signal-binding factor [Nanoarchaeota archaeon]|nr:NusA-like transcription termination signal-binding factor [Nanoarchaeota archaeon]
MNTKIIYDATTLQTMSLFERITRSQIKDCFFDEVQKRMVFIVQPGHLWRALGPKGANVKKLEATLNRKIKIVEFNPDKLQFIKNMVFPLQVKNITEENGIVTLFGDDTKTKGLLIGRNAANLRNLEQNVRRYFEITEIKVV